ncbi:MAG: L-rhamnose mutarotase [Clostridiaceae bacterium]|nr:L-rhamnose mutarotase [Clostridiaceae bacterium]
MKTIIKGFKMKLYEGMKEEYKKRHDNLWPEMRQMLKDHGAVSYSIFLDEETNTLFAYLEIKDEKLWEKSADTEICRKWWDYMADIMETNPDNSPVSVDLERVFTL